MNKSIVKHEIRSMKWVSLVFVLASLFLSLVFTYSLNERYEAVIKYGFNLNNMALLNEIRTIMYLGLVLFTIIIIIQVYMQFRSEKDREVGRFMKSLPIESKEFFKIKLFMGFLNIIAATMVLLFGIVVVKNQNMFWLKDIHLTSSIPETSKYLTSLPFLMKEFSLFILICLSFYSFLMMIQYTFNNTIGAIVTGFLTWLAPVFIVLGSLNAYIEITASYYLKDLAWVEWIYENVYWLMPWTYFARTDTIPYVHNNLEVRLTMIENFGPKIIISLGLIGIFSLVAYIFASRSRVEDEDRIISFSSFAFLFVVGVSLCSGLLTSLIFTGVMPFNISGSLLLGLSLLGGFVGFLISNNIRKVGR